MPSTLRSCDWRQLGLVLKPTAIFDCREGRCLLLLLEVSARQRVIFADLVSAVFNVERGRSGGHLCSGGDQDIRSFGEALNHAQFGAHGEESYGLTGREGLQCADDLLSVSLLIDHRGVERVDQNNVDQRFNPTGLPIRALLADRVKR